MVKGVNRRIVEITGMESDYFEKAVLYIRPDKASAALPLIELEAKNAAQRLVPKKAETSKKHVLADITVRLLSVSLILLAAALTFYAARV